MEINGNIPIHVARAYGLQRPAGPGQAAPIRPTASTTGLPMVSQVTGAPTTGDVGRSRSVDKLVAGTVHQPISFDGAATISPNQTLQLYTRAADKIEAAVAVNVGRSLDVTA